MSARSSDLEGICHIISSVEHRCSIALWQEMRNCCSQLGKNQWSNSLTVGASFFLSCLAWPRKLVGRDHWSQISEVPQLQPAGCHRYRWLAPMFPEHFQLEKNWWIPGELLYTTIKHGFKQGKFPDEWSRNLSFPSFLDCLVAALAEEFRLVLCRRNGQFTYDDDDGLMGWWVDG